MYTSSILNKPYKLNLENTVIFRTQYQCVHATSANSINKIPATFLAFIRVIFRITNREICFRALPIVKY